MKEKVFFGNKKGKKLCGIISDPTEDKEKPIIILVHGLSSGKDGRTFTTLEQTLNEKEISIFRFDLHGHGESEGKFEDVTVSEAVDDILNAIDFLKGLGYSKIGLVGSSFGGISAMGAASKSKDVFVLALKAPAINIKEKGGPNVEDRLEDWKKKGYSNYVSGSQGKLKLNYTFMEDAEKHNGYDVAKDIKIPVLIVHGDQDDAVPIEQSIKAADILENGQLEILKGTGHDFKPIENFEKLIELISEFITKHS
ncbi:alpha/beta hydrolase family protein [Nanoarchaeota archaeon]